MGNNDNIVDEAGNNDNIVDEPGDNDNIVGEAGNNDNIVDEAGNNDNIVDEAGNNDNIVDEAGHNNSSKKLNIAAELKKCFLNNIKEICTINNELNDNIYDGDSWLKFAQFNKINPLLDQLIDYIWIMFYHKEREKHEITNIDIDKDKDIDGYVYINNDIVDDKIDFVNKIGKCI